MSRSMRYVLFKENITGWWAIWVKPDPDDDRCIIGQAFYTLDQICRESGREYKEFPEVFTTHNDGPSHCIR